MSITRNAMILLALLPLSAACTPINDNPDNQEGTVSSPPMSQPTPPDRLPPGGLDGKCDAKAAQAYVGKTASPDVMAQAKAAAGASHVRILKPGQMVTMEYSAGRLNLDVDANNVITSARCG